MELSQNSLTVPACGLQAESLRENGPRATMKGSTRLQAQQVFISEGHAVDRLGNCSPGPAHYTSAMTLALKLGTFDKSIRVDKSSVSQYPSASVDLLQGLPDSQEVRFQGARKPIFGTEARGAPVNAPGLSGFVAGGVSPGPQAYAPKADSKQPKWTMRARTDKQGLQAPASTPARVGPCSYKHEGGLGELVLKRTQPQFSFSRSSRFPTQRANVNRVPSGDDGTGVLALRFHKKRPPAALFGESTRDGFARQGRLTGDVEAGATTSVSLRLPHERFDHRSEVLKRTYRV